MSEISEWMTNLRGRDYPQTITENYGRLPNEPRTVTYMGRVLEIPPPEHWMREHIDQNVREMADIADRYTEELAAERREAEVREARDRVMHHMWHPSDNESNSNELSDQPSERAHRLDLSIDSETGEITNNSTGETLLNVGVLFNPDESFVVADTPENCGVTAISNPESSWMSSLSVNDIIDDKYKEMEKHVEEQDKTIAELKSIIENLQDIVYQQKLDKEAKNLVL